MSLPDEDAAIFKIEVLRAVGNVWPTTIEDGGGSKMVPTIKRIDVDYKDDLFRVTGTFYDDKTASVVMGRDLAMASVPAAARNVIQQIKASRLNQPG